MNDLTSDVEINPLQTSDKGLEGARRTVQDPDRFLHHAKHLVMQNYNESHNPERTNPLFLDDIYIVWFVKTQTGWKSLLGSTELRYLLWHISYNERADEARIDVYKRINATRVKENEIT